MTSGRKGADKPSPTSDFKSAFGKALDEQLAKKNVKKGELAAALGVTPSYVSRILSGAADVSASNAARIASTLNLTAPEAQSFVAAATAGKPYLTGLVCPHCGKPYDEPAKGQ